MPTPLPHDNQTPHVLSHARQALEALSSPMLLHRPQHPPQASGSSPVLLLLLALAMAVLAAAPGAMGDVTEAPEMVSVAESACSVIRAASVSCCLVPHNQSNPSARLMTDEKPTILSGWLIILPQSPPPFSPATPLCRIRRHTLQGLRIKRCPIGDFQATKVGSCVFKCQRIAQTATGSMVAGINDCPSTCICR